MQSLLLSKRELFIIILPLWDVPSRCPDKRCLFIIPATRLCLFSPLSCPFIIIHYIIIMRVHWSVLSVHLYVPCLIHIIYYYYSFFYIHMRWQLCLLSFYLPVRKRGPPKRKERGEKEGLFLLVYVVIIIIMTFIYYVLILWVYILYIIIYTIIIIINVYYYI